MSSKITGSWPQGRSTDNRSLSRRFSAQFLRCFRPYRIGDPRDEEDDAGENAEEARKQRMMDKHYMFEMYLVAKDHWRYIQSPWFEDRERLEFWSRIRPIVPIGEL